MSDELLVTFFVGFQANSLCIDESSFTGEIEPVNKTEDVQPAHVTTNMSGRKNIAFMGSLVRTGNGKVSHSGSPVCIHVQYFI